MYLAPLGHAVAALYRGQLKYGSGLSGRERLDYYGHAPDKMEERPHLYQRYGEELFAIARFRWAQQAIKELH